MISKIVKNNGASAIATVRAGLFWLALAALSGEVYLLVAAIGFDAWGFPLDDGWIHQTYARNLAQSGQLAFVPGVPSAGSTAPLWSLLLSAGYLINAPFLEWAYGLGIGSLALSAWMMARISRHLFPDRQQLSVMVGLFCVFEWHLVWAAVSGMETMLFVALSALLVERHLACHHAEAKPLPRAYVILGLVGGLLVLTRPEGLGLVGLVGLDIGYRWWRAGDELSSLLKRWGLIVVGMAVLVAPYVIFHLSLTGRPFPSTLYAKQAEYGIVLESYPLWWRLFGTIGPPVEAVQGVFRVIFIGAQLLLIPGLVTAGWLTWRERRADVVMLWAWWVSFLLLYGFQLPVTYQHGRYQIPAIAWLLLLGLWGTAYLVGMLSQRKPTQRIIRRAVTLALPLTVLAFWIVGAVTYARDVRFIDGEMVAVARWLNDNIPADATIAAHDIGAIGYYTQRPLIDLAGLVTPEVIPIIRDEMALLDFSIDHGAAYLVTFPSWYPMMVQSPLLEPIHSTESEWSRRLGSDNMVVYRIRE